MNDPNNSPDEEPVQIPIEDTLDLHHFRPAEIKDLLPDYLEACRERGILEVRVIHGKGVGNLLRTVHALLERNPNVESFALANALFGGTGATIVRLRPEAGTSRRQSAEEN